MIFAICDGYQLLRGLDASIVSLMCYVSRSHGGGPHSMHDGLVLVPWLISILLLLIMMADSVNICVRICVWILMVPKATKVMEAIVTQIITVMTSQE